MDYKLIDLIDVPKTQKLLENFAGVLGVSAAIFDIDGEVLVSSFWQRLCTVFHNSNPDTRRKCIESNTELARNLFDGKNFALYQCLNGLTVASSPIVIEGKHLANAVLGQFLLEEPDVDFFERHAEAHGFDRPAYLDALSEIPRLEKEKLPYALAFLSSFAKMIATMGLNQLRQLEVERQLQSRNKELSESAEMLRAQNEEIIKSQQLIRSVARFPAEDPNPVLRVTPGGEILYMNPAARVTLPDFGEGARIRSSWRKVIAEAALKGAPVMLDAAVGDQIFSFMFVPVAGEDYLNIYGADITDRKKAEEELCKARDELEAKVQERTAELKSYAVKLEQSNRDLEQFAYIASHDLQEPLRKIRFFSDLFLSSLKDGLGEDSRNYLERMRAAAGRMSELISAILNLSRVSTRTEAFSPVNLGDVAKRAYETLEFHLRETGGEIEIGELPTVDADEKQMEQLFQNLIGNALKYQEPGAKPSIRLYSNCSEDDLNQIFVEDNGIGFEESLREEIFAPFRRLHGRSSIYEGTGMGLAICRKIVERHQGTITAASKPGKGSTFIVSLPKKQTNK